MIRILFIDDDSIAHRTLRMVLPREFHLISTYRGSHGIEAVRRETPDLVLLDIDLPDADGFDVLKAINKLPITPPVIMLTGFAQIRLVVNAMRLGAVDYLVKPYELESLTTSIKSHALPGLQEAEVSATNPILAELIGESPPMVAAKRRLLRYATSDKPVLITGESGTGKDLAARIVHRLSARASGPFVPRNCAAIPGMLFETEIFGSERGAFTDAVCRKGSIEQADGGTLFLDEIGELPMGIQAKLLRVLETGTVTRLGSSRPMHTEVRIVSATNTRIKNAIDTGHFRADLFYRISTLPVVLPPLRERPDDIPLIAAGLYPEVWTRLLPGARELLQSHPWPGNVRELKNVLELAELMAEDDEIQASGLSFAEEI